MTRKHTNNRMQEKPNNFWLKYGNQENMTKKAKWISNMAKDLETRRRSERGNTHRFPQNITKRNIKLENARPWWNTWILVQELNFHLRHTSTWNVQMLKRSTHTRMDDQRKDHIDPRNPTQRNRPKQLLSHNLLTDDVENINSTNEGRDLLFTNKPQLVPWRTERMP